MQIYLSTEELLGLRDTIPLVGMAAGELRVIRVGDHGELIPYQTARDLGDLIRDVAAGCLTAQQLRPDARPKRVARKRIYAPVTPDVMITAAAVARQTLPVPVYAHPRWGGHAADIAKMLRYVGAGIAEFVPGCAGAVIGTWRHLRGLSTISAGRLLDPKLPPWRSAEQWCEIENTKKLDQRTMFEMFEIMDRYDQRKAI